MYACCFIVSPALLYTNDALDCIRGQVWTRSERDVRTLLYIRVEQRKTLCCEGQVLCILQDFIIKYKNKTHS